MGKKYRNELDKLDLIYETAYRANFEIIYNFIYMYRDCQFYCIGSGGSYSLAAVFEYLCNRAGLKAKRLTPLELGQLEYQLSDSAAVLFTAGGSNNDSKNAYNYISDHEPEGILTCCMRLNAPIKKIQRINVHNYYFEYKMPVYKDGYLAVESLMSSIVILINSFEKITQEHFYLLPSKLERNLMEIKHDIIKTDVINEVINRESIFILYAGITMPAAVDLESKFSEASLGNTQLVDFRNFAHGRHFWISSRRDRTSVIALVGKNEKLLADKTLKLLPNDIPILRIDVDDSAAIGLIDAFRYCFEIVGIAANLKGMDPGKPHIDEFGKKLYHINYDIRKKNIFYNFSKIVDIAANRKASKLKGAGLSQYQKHSRIYFNNILMRKYRGIIFDYDGTLHLSNVTNDIENLLFEKINVLLDNGISIGIATGRGKSIREDLRKKISKKYWKSVPIAYYNGGAIGYLNDEKTPNKEIKYPESFLKIINKYLLKEENYNPYQITIFKNNVDFEFADIQILKEEISHINDVKVVETDHSIDIIPVTSSKNNIFTTCEYSHDEYLVIGDSGGYGGNDYELLNCETGLSVDGVSISYNSCWNYALHGMRNLEATNYYLDLITIIDRGLFVIKAPISKVKDADFLY
jgi:hydroxymethylpyrimidine pyrophosphatase-like HAD family hydrolase/fructoselysine-6-P-deglycase FrlB-like protein